MKYSFVFLFIMLIANQSFATNLTGSSASCDSGVLGIESGNIALRAEYEPESIELRWYNENNQLITVNSASQSCEYGGSITLPTTPTKTGYKFNGWKVINIFSTLNTSINGEHRYGKGEYNNSDRCWYDGSDVTCSTELADLNRYEWKTVFGYGIVYGISMCSTVSGTYSVAGNPINNDGQNCWCQVSGFKPSDSDIVYKSTVNLSWVFLETRDSVIDCASLCAYDCASYTQSRGGLRFSMFGRSGS